MRDNPSLGAARRYPALRDKGAATSPAGALALRYAAMRSTCIHAIRGIEDEQVADAMRALFELADRAPGGK